MEDKETCANCEHELDVGVDAIQVGEGVMGIKGFVPLEKTLIFCCEKCLGEYYDLSDMTNVPRRIP
jgi:hypothetical protein